MSASADLTLHTNAGNSVAKAWLRALELTAAIPRERSRVLPRVIDEMAARTPGRMALLSDRECLSYGELGCRMNQYARWALDQGISKRCGKDLDNNQPGVVCLLMPNRPEYLAAWLGITSVGGVVALINTNLTGPALLHSIRAVAPRQLIVAAEYVERVVAALVEEPSLPLIWTHGADEEPFRRIDAEIGEYPGHPLAEAERPPVTVDDLALYIYTSGTTGLPKAANVSHGRLMQWSHWFSGMMHFGPEDRMYNCLPMYHSVGGVQAPGAALVAGGSVVIREKFSASAFWADITRWECTTFQYIGELCRYLLLAAPSPHEAAHRVRLACGNGLAPDVWEGFKQRFRIPQILEFYASTEGGVSLFNVEEKRGAIGRIPPYLAHRFAPALVQIDIEDGQPVRDEQGFCRRAAVGEVGEALGRLVDDPSLVGTKYEGYADREAAERKILRNVFKPGDAWLRTGDLMRRDAQGFYYFVDRMGDTFRWKGENVATSEVAEVLCAFPGVAHATVYGVAVPGADGRAGMAAITASAAGELDLSGLRMHLAERLPAYARPRFLRLRTSVDVTGTFKYAKTELVRQGYDPANTATDPIYFDDPEAQAFVPLSAELYERIQGSRVRL